jgi:hypothetical protein
MLGPRGLVHWPCPAHHSQRRVLAPSLRSPRTRKPEMPQHRTPTRPEIARRLLVAHRLNLSLGISVAAANVLGYASIVVISASFGPADFGAVGAMTSLGVIAGIPAGTLMVITAGRVGRGEKVPWAYALGLAVGLVELLLITALSPVLMDVFDLDSWWPLLWLGLALVPATMSGGQQGVLLGSSRLGRLAVLFLVSGVARVAAAAVCIVAEPTVGGAYFFWLIASTVGLVVGHVLCHGLEPLHGQVRGLLRQASALGTASFGLLALITLTSVDTIFAPTTRGSTPWRRCSPRSSSGAPSSSRWSSSRASRSGPSTSWS